MSSPWLHRYALVLAVSTLFLVVAGASVTSKEAGLSVPDWPLSYGQVMPEMTGGVFYEHGHRMAATFVGMLTIGLAIWLWRADSRSWMRKLGWFALLGVIIQGVLGGLTVKLLLPPAVSVSHALLAQLFFTTTAAIALFTSRLWNQGPEIVEDHGWPTMRSLAILTPALVLVQIALGAGFRHRAIGLMPHVIGAILVSGILLLVAIVVVNQHSNHRALRLSAQALLAITFFQIMLGIGAYTSRLNAAEHPVPMVLFTVAHVAAGALTLASSTILGIHILRNVRTAGEPAEERVPAVR